ncbi:autotransporter domain-containing protein [Cetobacterium sp.]|uniref:autotransporter family protein n=1 Tax=Cetobacterium sp. TaxID=2071632 RepID=UPI003F31F309
MYLFNEASKILKSCCKNKVTLTTATVVSFLINGAVAFGVDKNYVAEVNAGVVELNEDISNKGLVGKPGVLNVWEDPLNLDTEGKQVTAINNATISQIGKGKAYAAVNISNSANFENNGEIIVNKDGQDIGAAVTKSFGNLNTLKEDLNTSSSLTNKGIIDIQNVSIANAVNINGYKKQDNIVAKDETELNNSGTIKISELTVKTINGLEKIAWNLLHDFKIDIDGVESEGSIGNGIIVGDNVNVTNSGTIDIINANPMAIKGTVDGEYKEVTFAGVGIGAAHSTEKAVEEARKSVKNEETGVIDLKGTNFVGIAGVGAVDVVNSGTIKTLGDNSAAVLLMKGATLKNSGTISIGNGSYGVVAVDKEEEITPKAVNEGEINITGSNSIGMFADNSEITNAKSGEIKLNIFEKDGKTVANNKAMYGINGSTVTNTGSIYLTDVTAETVGTAELKDLEAYVNNVLVSGDESTKVTNTGVVRNKDGKIIVAAGGNLSDKFPGIEVTPTGDYIVTDKIVASVGKDEVLKTDSTIIFPGDKLDLSINASEKFDREKFLVKITENSKVDMSGVLNAQDKGVQIDKSNVNITNSSIGVNSENKDAIALDIMNGSKIALSGTEIVGNVSLDGSILDIKTSGISGNISLNNAAELSMDKASAEIFTGIIEGNKDNHNSSVVLGDGVVEGKTTVTSFNGTVSNVDNFETNGILVMGEKSNFLHSGIEVSDENLLVIRVGEGENDFALSDNIGTLKLKENGHLMIETGRMNLKDGALIKLSTVIEGESANIHASDFIYDISILKTEEEEKEDVPKTIEAIEEQPEVEGTTLVVTVKDAKALGLDADVADVYESLKDAGKVNGLASTKSGNDKSEFNKILKQNSHKNGYSLGDKVSRDSIGVWNDVVKNNIKFLEAGEFKISGLSTGAFESTDTNVEYDFAGAGLMVLGEYGYDSKTTLGFSAAGGSVSGELDSKNEVSGDSFYFSVFGKKAIEDIMLTLNVGYQFNNLEGKRSVGNIYENYNFNEDFDTNGFNIDLEGRYIYSLQNDFTLEPHLGVNVMSIDQDSISENEQDGPFAMELDSSEKTTVKTKLGLELAKNIVLDGGSKVKLFGDISYVNNSGDVDEDFNGRFKESTKDFGVKPVEIGKNKGELSLGGKVSLPSGVFTDAKLTHTFGDGEYTKVTATLGYTF